MPKAFHEASVQEYEMIDTDEENSSTIALLEDFWESFWLLSGTFITHHYIFTGKQQDLMCLEHPEARLWVTPEVPRQRLTRNTWLHSPCQGLGPLQLLQAKAAQGDHRWGRKGCWRRVFWNLKWLLTGLYWWLQIAGLVFTLGSLSFRHITVYSSALVSYWVCIKVFISLNITCILF